VAVLQAHAQECGIDISGCFEKRELVQQILRAEPHELGGQASAGRTPARHGSRNSQSEAELREDERFARQLQAEEAARARQLMSRRAPEFRSVRAPGRGSPAGAAGGEPMESLMDLLRQAFQNGPQAQTSRAEAPPTDGRSPQRRELLEHTIRQQLARNGGARSGGDSASNAERSAAQSSSPTERSGDLPDVDVAAQALIGLIGQVLTNENRQHSRNDIAGVHALTEMLRNMMPQQGIDAGAVESRTATMTFAGGGQGAPSEDGPPGASEERKCMVCLEEFNPGEELRILPCLHRYHKNCIDAWLPRNRHCPVCKHDVTQ